MVKRNAIATKLTKICTQTQKQAFDVAVPAFPCYTMAGISKIIYVKFIAEKTFVCTINVDKGTTML